MPYRAMNAVVGIVGVAVLVVLVALGVNVYRAARTGPGWRRKLAGAGLVMLGSLGLMSCEKGPEGASGTKPGSQVQAGVGMSLEETPEWGTIQGAWEYVEPLAQSGKSTTAQRAEADKKLDAAKAAAEKLAISGGLSQAEAGLLTVEADRLKKDLYRNPPTDQMVTCYETMAYIPAKDSLKRLSERLLLLEQLTREARVDAPVLRKVLPTIEADVRTLSDEKNVAELQEKDREAAEEMRVEVEKMLKELKQRMEPAK